ncbi:MAG TPA: YCF48-related protein [Bryobacterales bacterium]|nr:YCF48-related protein [Bryobacterales bacterium]
MRSILPCLLAAVFCWSCTPLAAAERWAIRYFYDKNDSSLAFTDLQFPSAANGVALGVITERNHRKPVVVLTSDGGRSWEIRPLKGAGVSLFFLNERLGWLVGQKGKLWQTSDGGRTWSDAAVHGVSHAEPLRVFFLDQSRGWLLCTDKEVYSTADGGRSWELLPVSRKPDLPDTDSVYTWAAVSRPDNFFLTGWSRPPERKSAPDPTQPDFVPLIRHPTTAIILHTRDGGQNWNSSLLRDVGEIARLRISPAGEALLLLHRPDSVSVPSEIISLDLKTLHGQPVYANKERWIADVAFAGASAGHSRVLAAAVEQEGRTAFPALPSRLRMLESSDTHHWTEMEVDYRAEAANAILAVPNAADAWVATDTGMILKLVNE